MNKQDKLNYIRKEAIKANKDIVALEMGCKVKEKNVGVIFDVYQFFPDFIRTSLGEYSYKEVEEKLEIIGRPLTLADVLLAITINNFGGAQFDAMGRKEVWDTCRLWHLDNDNLENQNEDCIDFIYSLLKKSA